MTDHHNFLLTTNRRATQTPHLSPHGASSLLAVSVKVACHFAIFSSPVILQLAQADWTFASYSVKHTKQHGHITGR
ncbi:hypothetical protein HZ326_11017 [Fusarium oxysporum f. sp. albedinis]|nr:hypothetical protein HZ326_11017 [Fusarium oxysporum f. sp. albedinis]